MNPKPYLRHLVLAAPCALLLLLGGCSNQELYSQLSERQANEMVALLRSAGIDADKQSQEGHFSVLTSRGDFSLAVRTLNAQGYPRETFDSMGKVFKREGFVSSPLEERARLVHAMSQEISNTIANIDGVVTARVHLVMPERNPLVDKLQPASASVFIKHRPDVDLSGQVAKIKALVVNSMEGLPYDNVTVALFPAERFAPESAKAAPAVPAAPGTRRTQLDAPLLSGTIVGALAFAGGALLWWRRRSGSSAAAAQPALALAGAAPDMERAGLVDQLQAALQRAALRK
jgi:type III secretion protein J